MESVFLLVLVVLASSGEVRTATLSWHPNEASCQSFVDYYDLGPGLGEEDEPKNWGFVCLEERRRRV